VLLSTKALFNIILGSRPLLLMDHNSARIRYICHKCVLFSAHRFVRISVKLSPCVIERYAMKTYGGVDAEIQVFLKLTLGGREWSHSVSGRLSHEKRLPCRLGRRLGGPQVSRGENTSPDRDTNSDHSVVQPVASRCTDCAIETS
jgi:hypothetical protein